MAKFIPASVRRRSLEYLQSSYLPHRVFVQLFEKRQEGKEYVPDKDMYLAHVITFITSSAQWYALPASVRVKPEHSSKAIRQWFLNSDVYGESVYKTGTALYLRGYREIPAEEKEEMEEEEETSEEDFEINSFS